MTVLVSAAEVKDQSHIQVATQTDREREDRYPAASCGPVYVGSVDWFHTEGCETLNGQTGSHPEMLYAHESSAHTHTDGERD